MATDCGDGDYLGAYRRFFEDFVAQVDPDDQLPVKVSSYDLTEAEMSGEIIDWTLQYLNQKYCPPSLQSYLVHLVMEEVKLLCSKQPEACGCRFQDTTNNTFAPLKLMHAVTNKVNEICMRYLDNSRLALLPPPPSTPIPLVSRYAIKNSRRKMEDRHVVIHDLHTIFSIQDDSAGNYYAVFDGHAGQDAAVYCAAHLHQYLAESIHYPTDPERALRDAFLTTDAHFIEKSNKQNLSSGTTAVCALLVNKKLYIAWVGDSQAVLAKRGQITQLVNPHKPDRDDERERVTDMGGAVIHWGIWRVNGQLAVSRAIGDVQYKPYVTGDPDIRCIPLDGAEDFLIVACDGLWDFVSEAMATTLVYQQLREDPCDLEAVSQRLVYFARSQGSTDNISAIVVFLTNPRQIAARHPSSHPLLADVQLNNMESTNPFLSNANNGLQFEANPFGKQQQQQQPTNGTCAENEENIHYRDNCEAPSNGKHPNGAGFDNSAENPDHNDDDDEDDEEDDDEDDDDDLGPETDVDAVDEGLEAAVPTNVDNLSRELFPEKIHEQRENDNVGELPTPNKEQIATSPITAEPDQHALIPEADNVADSEDSEDEWNYYPNKDKERTLQSGEAEDHPKDEKATIQNPKSAPNEDINDTPEHRQPSEAGLGAGESHVDREVEQPELIDYDICAKPILSEAARGAEQEEDMDFQLNPNAAEFVPVSPPKILSTRANLNDDFLLSGSPQKQTPEMDDIPVPSHGEFQVEVSLRPHETETETTIENSNGEATKQLPGTEFTDYLMDRQKSGNGIGAAGLDESEVSSTKAEFGDESTTSFATVMDFQRTGVSLVDDSFAGSEREDYDIAKDPMAMSFTPGDFQAAFEKEVDDLNAIHQLNDSDLIGDDDTTLPTDEPFTAQSPDLHPELTTLVTPDTDHPPPTTAFPDSRDKPLELDESRSSPISFEPPATNDSNLVELIPSSCSLGSQAGAEEPRYQALDTSSPLDKAFASSPEPIAFCGISGEVGSPLPPRDVESSVSPVPLENQASSPLTIPVSGTTALEVADLLAEPPSSSPQTASPLPNVELVESGETLLSGVEKASAIPDMFSFEAVGQQESSSSPQPEYGAQPLDEDKFESHKEVYSPILDAELNVSQAILDSVVDTPPVSQNKSNFSEEATTSPDEQFKLVLEQSDFTESPAEGIGKQDILDELKSQVVDAESVLETLAKDEPVEKSLNSEVVYDVACPPFNIGNFSRKDLVPEKVAETEISQVPSLAVKEEAQGLGGTGNIVETETDSEPQKEAILSEEAKIIAEQVVAEVELKTLETLVNEVPSIDTPVMSLSESMQEFTGLEEQLNPEPQAPLFNGVPADVEKKLESQGPTVEAVENLVEQKIAIEDADTVKPVVTEKTEKKEETEPKTDQPSVTVPLAPVVAVAAAAAATATVVASSAAAAKTTKTKSSVKAAPKTATATKTTNKSTPTSPTKATSATQRTTGTLPAKKPATRPKQLETTRTSVTSTTSKSPAAKSTTATKTATGTKTTVSRTSTLTASKPKPTSTTSRPTPASLVDKKPTTNGDTKPASKPPAPKPTARTTTGSTLTASKTVARTSTTTARPASGTAAVPSRTRPASATAAAKPKPAATSTTTTAATARPKSSPASAAAPKVRSTLSKSPATDKQTKETTNKQLSSARTSGSTLTKTGARPLSAGTTTSAKRSLSGKNPPVAAAAQPQKKPAPITRPGGKLSAMKNAAKSTITSTTKTEVEVEVVQNGVSELHEKKTVVTNSTVEEDVPQKDVSPVTSSTDNQLIMIAD